MDLDSGKHVYFNLRGRGHGLAIIARVSNLLSAYLVLNTLYMEKDSAAIKIDVKSVNRVVRVAAQKIMI